MNAFDPSRTLTHGWDALKRSLAPMLVGAFIIDFLSGRFGANGPSGGGGNNSSSQDWDWDPNQFPQPQDTGIQAPGGAPAELQELISALEQFEAAPMAIAALVLGLIACFGVFFLLFYVVRSFMLGGWFRLHQATLVEGEGTFAHLFSGGQRIGAMLKLKILEGLLYGTINLGAVALAVFTWWFGRQAMGEEIAALAAVTVAMAFWMPLTGFLYLRTFAADRLLVFHELGPMDALGASWRVTGENFGSILVFFLALFVVYSVATVLSCCLCCFSFLVTVPLRAVVDTAVSEGVLLASTDEDPEGWAAFA